MISSLLTYKVPRRPASWVVYPVQTSCRVELALEVGTVQPNTATRSCDPSADSQPEVAPSQKPEVAQRPAIMAQPTALVPYSQIRTGGGVLFPPSPSREGADNRLIAAAYLPLHIGTGNRNSYDVIRHQRMSRPKTVPNTVITLLSVEDKESYSNIYLDDL